MKTRHLINHQRHGQAQLKNVPKNNKKKFLQQNPNKIPNNYNNNSKWVKENHRHVNQLRRSNKH